MKNVLSVFLFIISSFILNGQDLRIALVNGRSTIKPISSAEWRALSNKDVGITVNPRDSVCVVSGTLFIEVYKKGKPTASYWADTGDWTMKDIITGKAYHTHRPTEETGESVKGNVDSYYFDLFVNGSVTTTFHFGDHPKVRLINDNAEPVYFALLWLEGQVGWNMLDSQNSLMLTPKTSSIINTKDAFIIGPPTGKGEVLWVLSDSPFDVKDAITKVSGEHNQLTYLIKHITISE